MLVWSYLFYGPTISVFFLNWNHGVFCVFKVKYGKWNLKSLHIPQDVWLHISPLVNIWVQARRREEPEQNCSHLDAKDCDCRQQNYRLSLWKQVIRTWSQQFPPVLKSSVVLIFGLLPTNQIVPQIWTPFSILDSKCSRLISDPSVWLDADWVSVSDKWWDTLSRS